MNKEAYVAETISISLDELGVNTLTKQQIDKIASDVLNSLDMWGEYSGEINIPHPLHAELDKEKQKTKQAEREAERMRSDFLSNICMRRNVHPSQVDLEGDGHATIRY